MAAIKPNPASPDSTDLLSPKEAQLLGCILLHSKNKPDVDWEKVATLMNYKKGSVVYDRYRQISKKYVAAIGENGGGEGENETEGKADGITDGAGETTPVTKGAKKPRAPRKRKAADDGDAREDGNVLKKRAKKDTVSKIKVEVISGPEVKQDAVVKDEDIENDEPSQNIKAEVETSKPEEAGDV